MSPAYSPDTGLLYVSCREGSSTYYKGETEYRPGTRYWGSLFVNEATMDKWYGAVRAFHPVTAEKVWEHKLFRPVWAGLLSTAGGLVFAGGSGGFFKALDSESGEELWRINLGASILASPMDVRGQRPPVGCSLPPAAGCSCSRCRKNPRRRRLRIPAMGRSGARVGHGKRARRGAAAAREVKR